MNEREPSYDWAIVHNGNVVDRFVGPQAAIHELNVGGYPRGAKVEWSPAPEITEAVSA